MSENGFAKTPAPPYYAVIFISKRTAHGDADYAATAQRMAELVQRQAGYLGAEAVRGADGFGITVAYFDREEHIAQWRHESEHAAARARGRREWDEHFEVRVARVERAYEGP